VLLADVALPVPIAHAFTYLLPEALAARARPGSRVVCALGGRRVMGVVLAVREGEPPANAKAILHAGDDEPALPEDLLAFLKDLATYYFAPIGEVVRLALPPVDRDTARETIEPSLFGEARGVGARRVQWVAPTSQVEEPGTLRGQAAALLATVLGQDLEKREDGIFRIARRVAPHRVISTVDPEARHGHKTASRGFDGYKGHIAIDPDSEIITATEVTAGNVGDASAAETLLADVLPPPAKTQDAEPVAEPQAPSEPPCTEPVEIYGDASYGTADLVEKVQAAGLQADMKVQPPSPPRSGMFSQDDFIVDTQAATVTCPRGVLVTLRTSKDGSAVADFAPHCEGCSMRAQCTLSKGGRSIQRHPKHDVLDRARKRQRDPGWRARYRATRPKVERKIAHLMRRKHGGRRARMRGRLRVGQDFALLAAAINLARLARLGVCGRPAQMG